MVAAISEKVKSDERLTALLSRAVEYAEIYQLARKRQKGCDGMGEMATLKDEFKGIMDEVISYCTQKEYLPNAVAYDLDSIASELAVFFRKEEGRQPN